MIWFHFRMAVKKSSHWILIVWGLGLILGFRVSFAQDSAELANHVVIDIQGEAMIHRASWENPDAYEPLSLGEIVGATDTIRPIGAAVVTILCANNSTVELYEIASSPPCGPIVVWNPEQFLIEEERGSETPGSTISIVSPNGKHLNGSFTIEWQNYDARAVRFNVRIRQGESEPIWERLEVETTEIFFPQEGSSALGPGVYTVVVEPLFANGNAIPGALASAGIEVISLELRAQIENEASGRNLTNAREGMGDFLDALQLAQYELFEDAIERMEGALDFDPLSVPNDQLPGRESLTGSPQPYLRLGLWYYKLGRTEHAAAAFRKVLQLGTAYDYGESVAIASMYLSLIETDDFRSRYCDLVSADSFYKRVSDTGGNAQTVQESMLQLISSLGFAPTC